MTGKELLEKLQNLSEEELNSDVVLPYGVVFADATGFICADSAIENRKNIKRPNIGNICNQFYPRSKQTKGPKKIFLYHGDYAIWN